MRRGASRTLRSGGTRTVGDVVYFGLTLEYLNMGSDLNCCIPVWTWDPFHRQYCWIFGIMESYYEGSGLNRIIKPNKYALTQICAAWLCLPSRFGIVLGQSVDSL
jgi:hypothetical protein